MKKIDEFIDFYYDRISDSQRFDMRAMMSSFGVTCFNAARLYAGHNTFLYDRYIDYQDDIHELSEIDDGNY